MYANRIVELNEQLVSEYKNISQFEGNPFPFFALKKVTKLVQNDLLAVLCPIYVGIPR